MIQLQGLGIFPTRRLLVTNRTGVTLTKGGVYAIDITGSDSTSIDANSNISNLVGVVTGNIKGFLVVADGDTPLIANATGTVLLEGVIGALVDGTTDVAEGDSLIAQNGSINMIKQGATTTTPGCALALDAQTANAGTLTLTYFNGWALFKASTAGASSFGIGILADSAALAGDVIGAATETQFASTSTVKIPANSLKAGDIVRVHFSVHATATNSTDTFQAAVRIGTVATTLVATGSLLGLGSAIDLANDDCIVGYIDVQVRDAGATGHIVAAGSITTKTTAKAVDLVSTVLNTTVDQYVGVSLTLSTNNAGNTAVLRMLSVELIHA